jgi:hypothetical protein
MAYWLGRLVYGRPVGLLAGLLVAVSGGQLLYEHYIMSEGLFTVLITAASLLWVIGLRGTGNRPALLASGLMFGACALTRSYAVAILPLAVGLAFTAHLRGWRALKRAGLLVALGMAVVLAPWTARNYVVHGMLAPSGGAGQHLVSKLRSSPDLSFESEQAVDQDEDESLLEARELIQDLADAAAARGRPAGSQAKTLAYLMETYGLSEAQADDLMRAVAIDAIRAKPEVYAELVVEDSWENLVGENERLQSHWKLRDRVRGPEGGPLRRVWRPTTEWQEREQQTARRLMGIYQSAWLGSAQGLALLLGIVAAAIWPGARQGLFLAAMVLLAHVVTGLAVPGSARFHHPTDPLAQVVSVGGIWLLGSWVIARVRRGAVLERATRPRDLAAT